MVNVFGAAPVVFKPSAVASDGDFGPRLRLSIGKYEESEPPYIPNPAYQGKGLLIEGIQVATIKNNFKQKATDPDEKTVIRADRITVLETGEVFERQQISQIGVINQLKGLAGQSVIAGVGFYEKDVAGKTNRYVQLVEPSEEQQRLGSELLNRPAASGGGEDAPF